MYARYSSDQQDEKSIDDQVRVCCEQAARDGLPLSAENIFADHAVSGTKLRRIGLDKLLLAAANKQFSVLYFHSLSRLARESVITMPMLKQLVYMHRIRVISISEGIDTHRPGWEINAVFASLQHEQYLKQLSADVHRGQVGTVRARFSAGDYRFGYSSVPSPGGETIGHGKNARPRMVYVIDSVQAEWVRHIFNWYVAERQTLRWIVHELNRQNVPKDHRSSTARWHRALVIGILRSPKYIGLWSWGILKNQRDPSTGKVTQEERSEDESDPWMREFSDLRIIDDATFEAAQLLLDKNNEVFGNFRHGNGRLSGSPKGHGRNHLLSNIVQCGCCKSTMYVGGSFGKYLFCPGARDGICNGKSQLPRELAERMIFNAIGERILSNPIWSEAMYQFLRKSWQQNLASRPDEENELRKQIEACELKIQRLLDEFESNEPDPALRKRLQERRAERNDLAVRERQLQKHPESLQTEPTREWSDKQLMKLGEVLRSSTPAAGEALQNVLLGPIVLEQIPVEGRKRCFWRGAFVLRLGDVARVAAPLLSCSAATSDGTELTETITLDFRKRTKTEEQGDVAWQMSEQGMMYQDIAKELSVSISRVTQIMKEAAKKRGVSSSDGRLREASWAPRQQRIDNIQDVVIRMRKDGISDVEIARRINLTANTVRQIISIVR